MTTGGVLGHTCPNCRHPSHDHKPGPVGEPGRGNPCRHTNCPCAVSTQTLLTGPTAVYPLYVGDGTTSGTRLGYVVPPGQTLAGYRSCDCDQCRATHPDTARSGV